MQETPSIFASNCSSFLYSQESPQVKTQHQQTSNFGVTEFSTPITAGSMTDKFPGHAIFRSHDLFWKPLFKHAEPFLENHIYYLLPVNCKDSLGNGDQIVRKGHVRSNSIPASLVAPYRMSCDYQGTLKRSHTDVFSKYNNPGFLKVKLVISPEQLLEIFIARSSYSRID